MHSWPESTMRMMMPPWKYSKANILITLKIYAHGMCSFNNREHTEHIDWRCGIQRALAFRRCALLVSLWTHPFTPFYREVHISDLIKAHEGNDDLNPAFPSKIHWGKFNMMGKFVTTTVQCQNQCRNSEDYNFPQRPLIAALLDKCPLMITEVSSKHHSGNFI